MGMMTVLLPYLKLNLDDDGLGFVGSEGSLRPPFLKRMKT